MDPKEAISVAQTALYEYSAGPIIGVRVEEVVEYLPTNGWRIILSWVEETRTEQTVRYERVNRPFLIWKTGLIAHMDYEKELSREEVWWSRLRGSSRWWNWCRWWS